MNIKKCLITIIIAIIAILGMSTTAKATQYDSYSNDQEYKVNDRVFITVDNYEGNKNLLCLQHGQNLLSEGRWYNVVSVVNIEGTKSTDNKGKTIDSWYNARMAYIATSAESKDVKKNAMWSFAAEWVKKVGKKYAGISKNFAEGNPPEYTPTKLLNEATEYADFVQDGIEDPKDNTNQKKLKIVEKTIDNKEYFVVGPFKWEFSGKLKDIKVYNQNNKEISDVMYATYKGKELVQKEISKVKSGKKVYLLIPTDKKITKINKIEVTSNVELIKARLEFLEPNDVYWQNLVKVNGEKVPQNLKSGFPYNINFTGNLKVIKVDEKNQKIKLKDVGFIIQRADNKYVNRDEKGNITYVNKKENATEFVTNDNGEILIENLLCGTYTAYETKNPNYGYEIITEGQQKDVVVDKTEELKIKNKKYTGNLNVIKVDEKNDTIKLAGVEFRICDSSNKYIIVNNLKGQTIEGSIEVTNLATTENEQDATIFKTDKNGKIEIKELLKGTYTAYETKNPNYGYEIITEGQQKDVVVDKTEELKIKNKKYTGNLNVIKVDEDDHIIKLAGVEFKISDSSNKYIIVNNLKGQTVEGSIEVTSLTTTTNEQEATIFKTDKDGKIEIKELLKGTYTAYETKNPNPGYKILEEGVPLEVIVDKTEESEIPNEQLIKISGYVWEDKVSLKQNVRNDLYKDQYNEDPDYDPNDELIEGIIVRLRDKDGNIVKNEAGQECVTKTNKDGAYEFTEIDKENLENYYVEFEYDGIIYTNVVPHIDRDNGSKAAETLQSRENLNNGFASIEGTGETTGVAKDANGNIIHNLTYDKNKENYTSTFINDGTYVITSNTNETGFSIKDKYVPGQDEIKNINLGLYRRDQPDLAVIDEIENAKVTVNGFAHIYNYGKKKNDKGEYDEEQFNVGVKFGEKYKSMSYTAPIYQSDLDYITEDKDNELKVYITYVISLKNQTTTLKESANEIVDYYDSRYEIVKVGTTLDEKSNVVGELEYVDDSYNNSYKKMKIKTDGYIEAGALKNIYVQFKLSKEAVSQIINDKATLDNTTEIVSYSVRDKDGKTYAGVDIDSNPSNATPGDLTTYEDDTDSAPSLKLEIADARIMKGMVFLDATKPELLKGIREANGEYKPEDGDTPIGEIEVTLKDDKGASVKTKTVSKDGTYGFYKEDNEWKYEETTNLNKEEKYTVKAELKKGEFLIPGYIPGNYTLTYTWGNEEYNVKDYKGTIYNEKERMNDPTWYKTENPRYSDAIDNWETRKQIDKGGSDISTIESTTPVMKVGIEYDTVYTLSQDDKIQYGSSLGDKFIYQIKNIDFGIVERARQQLTLDKKVRTMKITLPNGQVIVDATVKEIKQGENTKIELEGQIDGVTAQPPIGDNLGFVKAELDSELIQGSILEIGYEIIATNVSETDYVSEYYYKYGYKQAEAENKLGNILKLNIKEMRDYLDNTLVLNENSNNWTVRDSDKEGKLLLITTELSKKDLAPGEQNSVKLNASKILSNKDENIFNNEANVTQVDRTPEIVTDNQYGRTPNLPKALSERVIVSEPTGENQNYILPIVIGITSLIILGAGIVIIRKKIIK